MSGREKLQPPLLMAERHVAALLLLKVVPVGQLDVAQFSSVSAATAQPDAVPGSVGWQAYSLSHTATATALHAAEGVVGLSLPQPKGASATRATTRE